MSRIFSSGTTGRRQKAGPPVEDTYRLTCYIVGDKKAFSILVPCTANVEDLTQIIYEKGVSNRFDYSILNMTFWKVCQDWRAV
jgi:hypothetical protein